MTKLKQIFADPLVCFLFLYVGLLPYVFFGNNVQSPFELPKYIFSTLTVILLFMFYSLRALRETELELKGSLPLLLLFSIFLAQTLSFAFSINPFVSFWGDFYLPADSWLSIAIFTAFALLVTQAINSTVRVRALAWIIALTAAATATHGGLQQLGLEFVPHWQHFDFTNGVFALQGQPVGYASLLGMSAPIVLILFVTANSRSIQILFGAIVLIVNLCILYSGSRAPVFTNVFISLLTLALLFWHRKGLKATKKILVALALIASANLIFYSTAGKSELVQKLQTKELGRGTSSRLLIWQNGFQAWLKNPVVGTGPETFSITQLALQSPEMNKTPYWNNYWSKAHNYIVHTLTSTGLLGLLSLLALLLYMTFAFFGLFRKRILLENELLAAGFSAGFLFLSIANLTAFNFVTTQMYGALFPVITGLLLKDFKVRSFKICLRPRLKLLFLGFIFLVFLPLAFKVVSYWKADMLYHETIKLNVKGNFLASMSTIEEAIRLSPTNPLHHCLKTDILLYLLKKNYAQLEAKAIEDTLQVMDETSKTCVDLGINRFQYFNSRGMIFGNLFYDKIISSPAIAENAFSQMKKMTPTSPTPYYRTGLIYSVSNREAQFLQEMNRALELKPDYYMAYKDLFLHAYAKKDPARVEALVDRVLQTTVYSFDMFEYLEGLSVIARKNNDLANYERLRQFFEIQKKNFH